ncbi:hypothetical protein QYE76_071603 [Lolium multiflorum]|uniref:Uncharacterized protein n=1 Tax=Lolium multiflorum TaxID=4521 RepID=A0AAD8SLN6_LOLMU|nr:hypothetical protein QYE76_071603 [Lolium multiflorum]
MGKKKGASTSDATKISRDWSASAISNRDVNKLRALGFISSSEDDIRLPGKDDRSRVSSADLSAEDLRDEVRRLTCLSAKDNIVLVSARPPYDSQHLPTEVPAVAQCYPPTPESGVEPEDDDENSEETEDPQHALEDSDVQEEEAIEDDAFLRSRRRKQIHKEFITTAESSPSGQDNDAVGAAPPPPAKKGPTSFFAVEDDLDPSDDDDEVPLAKRPKLSFGRKASVQEPKPSPAKSTPPSRTTIEKIPVSRVIPSGDAPASSAARDHPIYATVDAVVDFAEQFTRLESENAQLRKTVKTSADQVLEANRLAANTNNENILLKDELKKLTQQLKDEQDARREAAAAIDKKEGVLRESITNLLKAADTTVTRARMLREDSTADALSLATESNVQVLGLLQKAKGALSKLYSMIFPKAKQVKTLGELADAFLVDPSEPVEPIYATVDAVVDFAEQFTRLESENAQLRKTVKTSADQVLEANRLAANTNNENILLKDEFKKLTQQLKDEQDARREAAAAIDKKEGVLRESITNLLKAADTTVTRARMLREDSTADALSLATESNVQVLGLLQKAKGALLKLYSMIFPKAKQVKTLGELADAFLVDPSELVEVLKRCNRLFGAVLTFQLLMGHGMGSELEELSKALHVDDDNHLVDLEPFKRSAVTCANQLLKLVDEAQTKPITDAAPGSSSAL